MEPYLSFYLYTLLKLPNSQKMFGENRILMQKNRSIQEMNLQSVHVNQ